MNLNSLYTQDCLECLQTFKRNSIDLIYTDPPYNTNRDFADFKDKWVFDEQAAQRCDQLRQKWFKWLSFEDFIGNSRNNELSYFSYLVERFLIFHHILKETGSFYLHCDPKVSHYLKIILDNIFGVSNFQNEIIWSYRTGGATKRRFSRKHDIILFYTKSEEYTFNTLKERVYDSREYKDVPFHIDTQGKTYRLVNTRDVWTDIHAVSRTSKEREFYSTQKPLALLKRIITVSSNINDVILDPFCGSGTTLVAAQQLQRRWIGIDLNPRATKLAEQRLKEEQLFLV